MGALTYGAIEAGVVGFSEPRVVVAFVTAVAAIGLFIATERRVAHPMVPLGLFRSRNVAVAVAVGFAFVVGYYGLPFVASLYLQQVRGLSAFAAGLTFLPMMLVGAILTPFSARVAERLGARTVISAGLVLMAGGLALLAAAPVSMPTWVVGLLMVPVGVAAPMVSPPATAVLLNSAPDGQAGTASGVYNTSRQVGGALAVAVFGALLAQPDGFMHGLRTSLLIAAGVALAAAMSARMLHPVGADGQL
jgi:predicted MFS family arabinose efflux permease